MDKYVIGRFHASFISSLEPWSLQPSCWSENRSTCAGVCEDHLSLCLWWWCPGRGPRRSSRCTVRGITRGANRGACGRVIHSLLSLPCQSARGGKLNRVLGLPCFLVVLLRRVLVLRGWRWECVPVLPCVHCFHWPVSGRAGKIEWRGAVSLRGPTA